MPAASHSMLSSQWQAEGGGTLQAVGGPSCGDPETQSAQPTMQLRAHGLLLESNKGGMAGVAAELQIQKEKLRRTNTEILQWGGGKLRCPSCSMGSLEAVLIWLASSTRKEGPPKTAETKLGIQRVETDGGRMKVWEPDII